MIFAAMLLAVGSAPPADQGHLIYCKMKLAKTPVPVGTGTAVDIEPIGEASFVLRISKLGQLRSADFQIDDPSGFFAARAPDIFLSHNRGMALMFKSREDQAPEGLILTHENLADPVGPYRWYQGDIVGKPDGRTPAASARGACLYSNSGGSFEELRRYMVSMNSRPTERGR